MGEIGQLEDPVSVARALGPLIREAAAEADRERRLPGRVALAMAEAGLYRLSVAREFGGFECDPNTTIRTIEAIAEADGSAGWNLMIGLETGGIASGGVSREGGAAVFADPMTIMAGSLNALGRATPAEGGWRLTGRWQYASGIHNAHWFWAGATVMDGDRPAVGPHGLPRAIQLLVPARDYEIIDTWDVAGMRGSGSHDVAVHDVFVPGAFMTDVYASPNTQTSPLFRYPVVSRLCYTKVGVATGIARAAIDAFVELAGAKTPYLSRNLLRDRSTAQLAAAEAEVTLGAGRAFTFEAVGAMWAALTAGEAPSMELRLRQRMATTHAVQAAVRAVDLVHGAAGLSPNYRGAPLERHFRDVHVVPQHPTVSPAFMETAGRALLGLETAPGSY